MEIEFKLDESDLVALAKYQMEHSPAMVRRYRLQRYGLLAIFGLLSLVSYFILHKPALASYAAILALFCFSIYPYYYRWVVGRTMRQIVGAKLNPAVFAKRTLRITAEGLEQTAAGKKTVVSWPSIGPVAMTPKYAYIAVDGVYGQAIPRGRVEEQRLRSFVEALAAGRSGARAAG